MDEFQLEILTERYESIEIFLEEEEVKNLKLALRYAIDDSNTAIIKAGIVLEKVIIFITDQKIKNLDEFSKISSLDDFDESVEKLGLVIPKYIIININLVYGYFKLCSNSRLEIVKLGDLFSVFNCLFNILVWYIQDLMGEKIDYSKVGLRYKEKYISDLYKVALADGEINNNEQIFLDSKIKELSLPLDRIKNIDIEFTDKQSRRNITSESIIKSQTQDENLLNRRETRILEESMDFILQEDRSVEILPDLEELIQKYPSNKKVSEIYAFALKDIDLYRALSYLKNIKSKTIIESRIFIEILGELQNFNSAYDELEILLKTHPNDNKQITILEAYLNYLEWKETNKPVLLQTAAKLIKDYKIEKGHLGYLISLVRIQMEDIQLDTLTQILEPYYIKRLNVEISEKEFQKDNTFWESRKNITYVKEDLSQEKLTKDLATFYKNSMGIEFILIPSGKFMMGAVPYDKESNDDERPQRKMSITEPFYLGRTPVTQEDWEKIMGYNPSEFSYIGKKAPVEKVSWNEANEFIKKLNRKEGFKVGGYRLPTEIEWEYASRAGSKSIYHFGDEPLKLDEYSWFNDNSEGTTHIVGKKKPNQWGLYDMHGNVWEWCLDNYSFNHMNIRGGSWLNEQWSCRASSRLGSTPDTKFNYIGFRLLLSI